MPDMLVKLYDLTDIKSTINKVLEDDIVIRKALSPEKHIVLDWVEENFSRAWASECDVAFSNRPVSCIIATKDENILGFACYDSTNLCFFGPTGVAESQRGRGIGKALLMFTLEKMRGKGYAYAIIGGAGPQDFYKKSCGATVIEGSSPGIYKGLLK